MSIKVTYPNGRALQVKNEFAGRAGLCPHCKAQIIVPAAERRTVSEDDLLAVPTPASVDQCTPVASEPQSQQPPPAQREKPKEDSAARHGSSTPLRRTRVCPKCCEFISMSHSYCPRCHKALSEWTFPMPQQNAAESSSRSSSSLLVVRKHGSVTVIRFGAQRILDELTVKTLGDELFYAADRPDCHNLLLDFAGVVGLCSAMLGVMLLLRRKMSQKAGSIKLCQVGSEIIDVFMATKLGQLFEILDNEQQGLKAFA